MSLTPKCVNNSSQKLDVLPKMKSTTKLIKVLSCGPPLAVHPKKSLTNADADPLKLSLDGKTSLSHSQSSTKLITGPGPLAFHSSPYP